MRGTAPQAAAREPLIEREACVDGPHVAEPCIVDWLSRRDSRRTTRPPEESRSARIRCRPRSDCDWRNHQRHRCNRWPWPPRPDPHRRCQCGCARRRDRLCDPLLGSDDLGVDATQVIEVLGRQRVTGGLDRIRRLELREELLRLETWTSRSRSSLGHIPRPAEQTRRDGRRRRGLAPCVWRLGRSPCQIASSECVRQGGITEVL